MRYAQGGGLTDAGRAARERVRLQVVERFEDGQRNREIAAALRVSERSVERWRRQWRERGEAGVLSKGSPGRPRLNDPQIARLERELSLVKRDIGNLAAADLGQITRAVKRRLKQIQYRPDLVDGCLTGTGLRG